MPVRGVCGCEIARLIERRPQTKSEPAEGAGNENTGGDFDVGPSPCRARRSPPICRREICAPAPIIGERLDRVYIGGFGGYGAGTAHVTPDAFLTRLGSYPVTLDPHGGFVGVDIGYNYQTAAASFTAAVVDMGLGRSVRQNLRRRQRLQRHRPRFLRRGTSLALRPARQGGLRSDQRSPGLCDRRPRCGRNAWLRQLCRSVNGMTANATNRLDDRRRPRLQTDFVDVPRGRVSLRRSRQAELQLLDLAEFSAVTAGSWRPTSISR